VGGDSSKAGSGASWEGKKKKKLEDNFDRVPEISVSGEKTTINTGREKNWGAVEETGKTVGAKN